MSSGDVWRPTATPENLRRRAAILHKIRTFFADRDVLEVDTPTLAAAPVTDLHLDSLRCTATFGTERRDFYLQTSPEYAMKRLLAAGSGAIFQICKAYRDGEVGRLHELEFTMLEWYRPGFDHHALMDEMDALLGHVLEVGPAERLSYGELFRRHLDIDPHHASVPELAETAKRSGLDAEGMNDADRDTWLQLLISLLIEPRLDGDVPTFVYDFPASQAALARIRDGEPPVAERFEVYFRGIELANGFHELADANEQRRRFEADLEARRQAGKEIVPIDEHLLAALDAGFPDCAGVALGVDRLVMLALGATEISAVVAFPKNRP